MYTDHKNLIRDALGLKSDLLEECGPKIVYIKDIHNTVPDAISRLKYDPSINRIANFKSVQKQNWMTVSKTWCNLNMDDITEQKDHMNLVFDYSNKDSARTKKRSNIEDLYQKRCDNIKERYYLCCAKMMS